MPRANNHAQAQAAARIAADAKLALARGKDRVSVDRQVDRFAATARAVKAAGDGPWTENPDQIYNANSGRTKRTT